jgi:CubicO group peptidase (beta-lactamase class C family)
LDHGAWAGKQIVSASWLDQSTTEQIKARALFSYGFLWWLGRSSLGDHAVEGIAALGSLSQKVIIIPALDMVVVFNASLRSQNMVAPEIGLLDQYILPAVLKPKGQ